jgi:hypothetical protein
VWRAKNAADQTVSRTERSAISVDPTALNQAKVDQMTRFLWRQAADGGVRMSYQNFGEAVKVHHRELSPWLYRISGDEMNARRPGGTYSPRRRFGDRTTTWWLLRNVPGAWGRRGE